MSALKASCCWVSRRHTGAIPSPRQGHSAATFKGKIFVFGGSQWNENEGKTDYHQSMHCLSPEKEDLVWTEVPQNGVVPSARDGHVLLAKDESLILIGGKNQEEADTCLPGVHQFDINTATWTEMSTSGSAPSSVGFSASLVRREVYCFGGFSYGQATADIHMLFLDTQTWTILKPSGITPVPRCDHGAAVVGERIFIFGGCGGENVYFNDLAVFDTNTLSWRQPRVHGRPPAPRGSFSFISSHDKDIFLFGGTSENPDGSCTLFNDVVKLSLVAREASTSDVTDAKPTGSEDSSGGGKVYHKLRWKRPVHVGRTIGPLYGHTAAILHSHLYIVGGMNSDGETNRVLTLRLLSPSERVPILKELMQQYEAAKALVNPPELDFDLEAPPFQKPSILSPLQPSSSSSRLTADIHALKTQAIESKKMARDNVEKAFESLVTLLGKFEEQKIAFSSEKEMFAREQAAYKQQYEDQQNELSMLIQRHREQMELWIKEQTEEYVAQQKRHEDEWNSVQRQQHEVAQEKTQLEQSKISMMHVIQGLH